MKNINNKNLPVIASITIGTRFWEQELSFEKYSKDLVKIFSTQSGEPIGDYTKSLFFGTVPIKNMIEETSRLLLNDCPKITGFSFSVLLKNISEKKLLEEKAIDCYKKISKKEFNKLLNN